MALRGKTKHYLIKDIQRRHFNLAAVQSGLGSNAESLINDILARTNDVIASVQHQIPARFPLQVADTILAGLSDSARRLESATLMRPSARSFVASPIIDPSSICPGATLDAYQHACELRF